MRVRLSPFALLALSHLSVAVDTVSLADFLPRVANLPKACQAIYTSTVSGCYGSDFTASGCSIACVNGLQEMSGPIFQACGNQGISGENVVTAFLAGHGPGQICKNAEAVLAAESSSSAAAATSTTASTPTYSTTATVQQTSTLPATSATSTDASTSTSASAVSSSITSTSTSSTSSSDTTSVASTSTPLDTASRSTDTASSTHSNGASQTSVNDGSGGGSPFDSQGNVSGASVMLVPLGLGIISLGALLFSL